MNMDLIKVLINKRKSSRQQDIVKQQKRNFFFKYEMVNINIKVAEKQHYAHVNQNKHTHTYHTKNILFSISKHNKEKRRKRSFVS